LEQVGTDDSHLVPVILLRAAVLADIDRKEDAKRELQTFDAKNALPEEANLATVLRSRLKDDSRVTQVK
jgi:hypothetical protein